MDDQATKLKNIIMEKMTGKRKAKKKKTKEKEINSRVIAVASGKGGVGKSTITVNLALALQELKKRVFIIDSDIGMANIDIILDVNSRYDMHHVFKGICSFEEAIATGPYGISVLSGISGLDKLVEISIDDIKDLLTASSEIDKKYDVVLLDTGAGASRSVINFITAAGEVLIVLTPEPTSIMDAYSLIKLLSARNYPGKAHLIINQVESKKEAEQIANRMTETVNKYLDIDLDLLGFIPYDSVIPKSIKKQHPVFKLYPGKTINNSFMNIASKLIGKEPNHPSSGIKSFIYRMVGMVKRGG